jgi:hypothetical protein
VPADEVPFSLDYAQRTVSASPPVLTLVPPASGAAAAAAAAEVSPSSLAPAGGAKAALDGEDRIGAGVPLTAAAVASGSMVEALKAGLEKRRRMFLVIALEGARRVSFEAEELVVEFAPEAKHLRDNLAKPESVKMLREVCRELTGRDMGVRISVKEASAQDVDAPLSKNEEARREKQLLREMAERHPAVQELLETFRGEIVDVRRIEDQ